MILKSVIKIVHLRRHIFNSCDSVSHSDITSIKHMLHIYFDLGSQSHNFNGQEFAIRWSFINAIKKNEVFLFEF